MKKIDRFQNKFAAMLFAGMALLSAVAQAQGMNVAMPIASSCPVGYHWEMAAGFAQCVADPPPVPPTPPTPPASSYPYVYEISMFFFDTTQKSRVTKQVIFATGGGGWNSAFYETSDVGQSITFPWGGDLSWFWYNTPSGTPADLYDPVKWFADKGCRILSTDSSVQGIVDAAVGAAGGAVNGPATPRYGGNLWVNFAACPSRVI